MVVVNHPSYLSYYFDVRIFDHRNKDLFHFQAPHFPFVSNVTVNFQRTSDLATISLTFDAPFRVGRAMLNSNMFLAGNNCQVIIGYHNGPQSQPFYGYLHQGGIGLELSPNGLSGTVSFNQLGRVALYESVQKTNDLKLAYEDALRKQGYKDIVYQGKAEDAFNDFAGYRMNGRLTNQEVIDLAENLTNAWHYPDMTELLAGLPPETAVVMYEPDQSADKPKRKFVMRGQFSEADRSYPIFSFGPELTSAMFAFSPAGASGLEAPHVDEEGKVEVITAKPEDADEKAGQKDAAIEPGKDQTVKSGEGGKDIVYDKEPDEKSETPKTLVIPGPAHPVWGKAMLKNLQSHLARREGWSANIVTVGIPDIDGSELCEVVGMGRLFDGNYEIDQVTHQCAMGDFSTTLNVISRLVKTRSGANTETAA